MAEDRFCRSLLEVERSGQAELAGIAEVDRPIAGLVAHARCGGRDRLAAADPGNAVLPENIARKGIDVPA